LSNLGDILIHLVRHGRVASHRGDVSITEQGRKETRYAGMRMAESVKPSEEIHVLCTSNVRSKETAATLYETLKEHVGPDVELAAPREEWAIRNPDQFLAGRRVEMVSTAQAIADQIPGTGASVDAVDAVAYYHAFFRSSDRIGYWLEHPSPPGEDSAAVGRRIVSFCTSLLDLPAARRRRYVCVTHSPVMRAVLVRYMDHDPGEPGWVERVDLVLRPDESTITYRDRTAPLLSGRP